MVVRETNSLQASLSRAVIVSSCTLLIFSAPVLSVHLAFSLPLSAQPVTCLPCTTPQDRVDTQQIQLNLRSNSMLLLIEPKSRQSWGDRCFSLAASRIWNSLPLNLRSCLCTTKFKSLLKTYLISQFSRTNFIVAVFFVLFLV